MKRSTLKLVLAASAAYYLLLLFVRSFFKEEADLPLYILVAPLFLLVAILAGDLSFRATVPSIVKTSNPPSRKMAREVRQLARQIQVASHASPEYFNRILVSRLRETLVEKVRLETGLEESRVREILANPRLGPGLLRDEKLYRLLYSPLPGRGPARAKMLEEAVARIEDWKP